MTQTQKIQAVIDELKDALTAEITKLDVVANAFELSRAKDIHDDLIKASNKLNDIAGDCLLLSRADTLKGFSKEYYIYSAKEIIENPDVTFYDKIPLVRWHVDGTVGIINKQFLESLRDFMTYVSGSTEYECDIIGGYIPATKRYESEYYGKLMKMGKSCLVVFSRKTDRIVAESRVATKICRKYVEITQNRNINFDVHGQQVLIFTHPNVSGQVNINARGFFKQGKHLL